MVEKKFTMEAKSQDEWAWLLALYLFLGSLGGCLYLLFWLFRLPPVFALASIGLVLLGAAALMLKLGSPLRAWRSIFRPGTSWISRGVLFVALFILFGGLSIAPAFDALSWLPWNEASVAGRTLTSIAGLSALLTAVYPGFVVFNARAIPFWNTPLLPLLFFSYAAMTAGGTVLLGSPFLGDRGRRVDELTAWLIVVNLVLLAVYLIVRYQAADAARESVRRLFRAPLNAVFAIGVVAAGLLFPLLAILWLPAALAPASACLLIGGLLFRYCVLKAGVYHAPAAFAPSEIDLGKINRTSADLEREYRGWRINA